MSERARVRIKMCGMTRSEDIQHAIKLGVDAIGIIFYQKSPRCVTIEQAKQLLQNIPAFLDVVAVVVNPDPIWLKQLIAELPIQYLQFHGDETPAFCEQFALSYIKAISAHSSEAIVNAVQSYSKAAAILLDTPTNDKKGGTGISFDWGIIPQPIDKPLILAGGMTSLNVNAAILASKPYAIDVSSGVEISSGIKDHAKMSQFVKAVWGGK